jgi:hypothetical protein
MSVNIHCLTSTLEIRPAEAAQGVGGVMKRSAYLATAYPSMLIHLSNVYSYIYRRYAPVHMLHSQRCIELSAAQAIRIHGWTNPRRICVWNDLDGMTLNDLLSIGIPAVDLHHMQPDVHQWIKHNMVGFSDVDNMLQWPLHPIKHLHGDLSDIMQAAYPALLLHKLKIRYNDLIELNMTPKHMQIFHYPLRDWQLLGFTKQDLLGIPNELCMASLGVAKVEAISQFEKVY